MPSSYSSSLRLELIETGDKSGQWGDITNRNMGTLLETAISGVLNLSISGDTTLTAINGDVDQSRNMVINLTGTLTGSAFLSAPNVKKLYFVRNGTSGGHSVTVRPTGGSGVVIPNGTIAGVYFDGAGAAFDLISNLPSGSRVGGVDITTASNTQTLSNKTLSSVILGTPASGNLSNCTNVPLGSVSGTLAVANGGTGVTTSTGTGSVVLSTSPTLTTPALGTPASGNLSNCTSIPSGQLTGLGTGVSGGLSSAINGAGGFVGFSGALGTPASGNLGNCTNVPLGSVSGTLAVANGGTGVSTSTGSGNVVLSNSPTLSSPTFTTPVLGTPSSGTLTNCTGLAISNTTGTLAIDRGGTGIATAPANGQILIGNSSTYSLGTISGGTGVTVSSTAGAISVAIGQAVGTGAAVTFSQVTANTGIGCGTAAPTGGAIWATGDIIAFYSSDSRYKENVSNIESALESLGRIRGVRFDWTQKYIDDRGGEDGYFIRKHDIGVIAQEIEAVIPEAVGTRESGYKAVRYEKIVPLLIEAVKELKREVDELRAKL